MVALGAVREVERWTPGNVLGGIVLLVVLASLVFWALRRFLRT